jgi:hypothetical protein
MRINIEVVAKVLKQFSNQKHSSFTVKTFLMFLKEKVCLFNTPLFKKTYPKACQASNAWELPNASCAS